MVGQVELLQGPLANGRPPGKPLVIKENWTAALSDQLRLFSVQLVCSGGSSALAKTMVAPLERIKILLQVQHMASADRAAPRYTGVRDVLTRLPTREGGVLSLWRGNGANVARLFPDVAFRFAIHDQFRVLFAPLDGSPPGVVEKLSAGAATGVLKTALFYPLDLCRTRITADQSLAAGVSAAAAAHRSAPAAGMTGAGGAGGGAGMAPGPLAATGPGLVSSAAASQAAGTTGVSGRPAAGGPGAAAAASQARSFMSSAIASAAGPASVEQGQAALRTAGQGAGPGPGSSSPAAAATGSGAGRTYPNIRTCMVATLREEGVRGLYRGCLLSMGGVAPYLAISFTMYDELRRRLPSNRESVSAWWYPLLKMGCGAAAAVSAQTVVYPLDTVRRCMQMNGAAGQAVRYTSAYDCLRQLLRSPPTHASSSRAWLWTSGVAALYRGCAANCLKTSIGAPIHFVMYDAIKGGIQALDPTTGVSSPL